MDTSNENTTLEKEQVIIDTLKPFSKSAIWKLQSDYFNQTGIDAWSKGEVPHYITSNPTTGKIYAELAFAFLRDLATQGNTHSTVYLLELGAGHGRFCYHFLKYFESLADQLSIKLPPFCYILSDIAEANLNFWKTHPRLQPYLERGWLDFALVDATDIDELILLNSKKNIKAGSLKQPLIIVANYFFDTIPQELFYIEEKKLCQSHVSITAAEEEKDKSPAELIKAARLTYENHYLDKLPYEETYLNEMLENYIEKISGYLLYPHIGLQCIHQLQKLSDKGVLLLTADKGYHREEKVALPSPPQLVTHGSFSLTVNYHAIKTYCENSGGKALFPYHLNFSLNMGCLFFVKSPEKFEETQLAYKRFVRDAGPDEFFSLKKIIGRDAANMSFGEIISILRISGYDIRIFGQMLPVLSPMLENLTEDERWTVYQVIHKLWDNYYPLGETYDFAFELAHVLFLLHFFEEAVTYFKLSVKLYGRSELRLYGMTLCYCSVGQYEMAASLIEEILEINPAYESALQMKQLLISEQVIPGPGSVE